MKVLASDDPGWMHVQPWTDDDAQTKKGFLDRLLGSSGPAIPNATWVPGASSGDSEDQIGITHGSGPNAFDQLTQAGVTPPTGWTKRSDHRQRGLVLVGPGGDHDAVLDFMLAAAAVLSVVPTDDRWMYGVSRRL